MRNWLTYAKERFPLPVYLTVCGGFAFSGLFLFDSEFNRLSFAISYCGLGLFFFQLRLMDEIKDYDKDAVAHPHRPLPRGLIGLDQSRRVVKYIFLAMLVFALLMGLLLNTASALSYLVITLYTGLMYKEFFAAKWLAQKPVFYAVSHQVIIFAVCIFTVTATEPGNYLDPQTYYLGLMTTASFFCYEICRKLDPQASRILNTYLHVHGPVKTASLVITATGFTAAVAAGLNLHQLLWPAEVLLIISAIIIVAKPRRFKWVERTATFSLGIHLWAVAVRHSATAVGTLFDPSL